MIGAVHMPTIQIYTTRFCPYCVAAIRLLKKKGAKFNEIAVDGRPDLRAKMTKKSGATSVPQIWIGGQHIGGCDELYGLESRGKLDQLLTDD